MVFIYYIIVCRIMFVVSYIIRIHGIKHLKSPQESSLFANDRQTIVLFIKLAGAVYMRH
jgi:hypothetical protein